MQNINSQWDKNVLSRQVADFIIQLVEYGEVQFNRNMIEGYVNSSIRDALDYGSVIVDQFQEEKEPEVQMFTVKEEEQKVTLKKILADKSTQIVFQELITEEGYQKLISDFCNIWNIMTIQYLKSIQIYRKKEYERYKDICLVYKGGNIVRLYTLPLIRRMKCEQIEEKIKRSDADLSVWINDEKIKDYEQVIEDIQKLSIYSLEVFRQNVGDEIKKCLPNLEKQEMKQIIWEKYEEEIEGKYNNEERRAEIMQIQIDDMCIYKKDNEICMTKTDKIPKRSDFYIEAMETDMGNSNQDSRCKVLVRVGEESLLQREKTEYDQKEKRCPCQIFISQNKLKFKRNESISSFYLIRAKINIKIQLEITDKKKRYLKWYEIPSELLDISIPLKDDTNQKNNVQEGFEKQIQRVRQKIGSGIQDIYIYRIDALRQDIEKILFKQERYPWEDTKYTKRLFRYILLSFIMLWQQQNEIGENEVINVFEGFKNYVKEPENVYLKDELKKVEILKVIIQSIEKTRKLINNGRIQQEIGNNNGRIQTRTRNNGRSQVQVQKRVQIQEEQNEKFKNMQKEIIQCVQIILDCYRKDLNINRNTNIKGLLKKKTNDEIQIAGKKIKKKIEEKNKNKNNNNKKQR